MARPGLGKLQALQNDEARIITRIHELEHILSSPSTSIVQQSKAKVELSQLQRQVKQVQCTKRQSMRNLGGAGIVTKNRAVLNSEEERLKREEEIRMLHLQLQSEGVVATQQQIEEKIKIAKMELDALDNVEEGEGDDADAQDVSDVGVDEEDDMSDIEEEVKEEDSSDEEGVIDEETKGEDNNNESTTTKPTSLLKLQSLQQKSLRIISRIHKLESILADTTVSTVKRTQAKVELAQLQRKEKRVRYTKRLSMTNLGGAGIVTKNRALLNAKDDERRRHEEEIRMLHLQLQNRGAASNSNKTDDDEEEVRKIEEQLKIAQMALEELDKEEEEEEILDEKNDDEYVTPVTTKLNHNGASSDGKQQENENILPVESANNDASTPPPTTKQPPKLGRRASVQNVNTAAIVSKNRALWNAQHEGRLRHEEEIQRLQLELQNASEEQRRRLEELLKAAQKALEALDVDDKENGETQNPAAISEDEEYVSSVSMKMNHVGTQTDDNAQVEEGEEKVDTYQTIMAKVSSDNYSKRTSVRTLGGAKLVTKNTAHWNALLEKRRKLEEELRLLHEQLRNAGMTELERKRLEEEAKTLQTELDDLDMKKEAHEQKNGSKPLASMEEVDAETTISDNDEYTKSGEGRLGGNSGDIHDLQYWKTRAEKYEAKCLEFEGVVEEQEKIIAELREWKRLHEELNVTRGKQQETERSVSFKSPPPPRPSLAQMKGSSKSRRFTSFAARDPSFSNQLKQASQCGDVNEQMKETAKIEMKALEALLKDMDGEKAELLKELATMKAILAAANGEKPGKKTERLVYQLSCKKCNQHMNFVGTTHTDLKTTMQRHFDQVVKATKSTKSKKKSDESVGSVDDKSQQSKKEAWHEEFALHFAKHCKPKVFKSVSEKEVIAFCQQNVKLEVLRRSDGAELYWEDEE